MPDKNIDKKILDSAKKEFLNKGFANASLRYICAEAGVTTGALYKRYSKKEELFQVLVQDVIDDIEDVIAAKSIDYDDPKLTYKDFYDMWSLTEGYLEWWYDFLSQRRDGFKLLVKCSEGSQYQNFQHDLVERICKESYKCYCAAAKRGMVRNDISHRELHVLTTSFWSTMYEPFIHDFTEEEIQLHCRLTAQFIDWHRVLGFREPQI